MLISQLNLGILTKQSVRICSLPMAASSGHLMNCRFLAPSHQTHFQCCSSVIISTNVPFSKCSMSFGKLTGRCHISPSYSILQPMILSIYDQFKRSKSISYLHISISQYRAKPTGCLNLPINPLTENKFHVNYLMQLLSDCVLPGVALTGDIPDNHFQYVTQTVATEIRSQGEKCITCSSHRSLLKSHHHLLKKKKSMHVSAATETYIALILRGNCNAAYLVWALFIPRIQKTAK